MGKHIIVVASASRRFIFSERCIIRSLHRSNFSSPSGKTNFLVFANVHPRRYSPLTGTAGRVNGSTGAVAAWTCHIPLSFFTANERMPEMPNITGWAVKT